MRLTSIFVLLSAALAAFTARGITVNATVDSRIESVKLTATLSDSLTQTMGPVGRNGSDTWTAWAIDTAYTPAFSGVPAGYTARWKVTVNGVDVLSGGAGNSITLQQSHAGCTLSFYGEPATYAITFDRQPGSGGTASTTATYGAPMPSITPPTRTGYEFCSYTNSQGVSYYNADGTSAANWNITSGATLYAQWKAAEQIITFDRQLGTGGTTSTNATYDAPMPTITPPIRPGYEFCSYNTAPNGGGTQYYNADGSSARTWDKTEATTLYAYWAVITNTVSLNPQGGINGTTSITATYASPMPTIKIPERPGFKFHAYYSEPGGVGTRYYNAKGASARKWDQTTDATLYAQWLTGTYAVLLNQHGGSGGTESVTATYGEAMPPITIPIRPGYDFSAYTTAPNGAGVQYYNADGSSARNWDITSNATLHAYWIGKTIREQYEIGYDNLFLLSDFAFNSTACQSMTDDGSVTVDAGTAGTVVISADKDTSNVIISSRHAQTNLVDSGMHSFPVEGGVSYTISCSLEKSDGTGAARIQVFFFDADGNCIAPGGIYDAAGPELSVGTNARSLTAPPTAARMAVFFSAVCSNGQQVKFSKIKACKTEPYASVANDSVRKPYVYGESTRYGSLATPSRTGYEFGGWFTAEDGGGSRVTADNFVASQSATLYSKWTVSETSGPNPPDALSLALAAAVDASSLEFKTFGTVGDNGDCGEDSYDAKWSAQENVFEQGPSAAQSGVLPVFSADEKVYCSWLTTTVTAPGVLSFSWKCAAKPLYHIGGVVAKDYGDILRFGVIADGHFEELPEVPRLDGVADWQNVVYTNNAVDGVTFAWSFTYSDRGRNYSNGGGTGWVDRVVWAPKSTSNVTLDQQGGSNGTESVTAIYGEDMPSITVPILSGYVFYGYWSAPNGGGTQYYSADGEGLHTWEDLSSSVTIYAKWMPESGGASGAYVVELDPQGGNGYTTYVIATNGVAMPAITPPTRPGYEFSSYTNSTGTTYYNADGTSAHEWDQTANAKLYAQWNPNTYEVTFNGNGADRGEMANQTLTYDVPTNLTPCAFQRTGYGFAGWTTNSKAETINYTNCAEVVNLATGGVFTLYAKWETAVPPTTCYVTLNKNYGGSTSGAGVNLISGSDITQVKVNAITRTGYDFLGYFTSPEGGERYFDENGYGIGTWNITSDHFTLYAHWALHEYTVTLDPQGGSGGDTNVMVHTNALMPKAKMPERAGYKFLGYYENTNGGGTQYYDADGSSAHEWNKTHDATISAHWEPLTYEVTLELDGGVTTNFTVTYDAAMPSITPPTRTGYTFGGYTNEVGTLYYNSYGASASDWNLATSTALYAKWEPRTYTVTLEPSPGSGGSYSVTATYGAAMPMAEMPTRPGYEFCSYTNSNGTTYYNADGTSARPWDLATEATLYAYWTGTVYTVTFNDGSGAASTSITYGDPIAPPSERTGYTFGGYFTQPNGGGTKCYNADGSMVESVPAATISDTTLNAYWMANTYTVVFNANGGEGDAYSMPCTYDVPTNLTPCAFTRTGYGFAGWSTSSDGSVVYADCASISNLTAEVDGAVSLYAQWSGNMYEIGFDNLFLLCDFVANARASMSTNGLVVVDITNGTIIVSSTNENANVYTQNARKNLVESGMYAFPVEGGMEYEGMEYSISFTAVTNNAENPVVGAFCFDAAGEYIATNEVYQKDGLLERGENGSWELTAPSNAAYMAIFFGATFTDGAGRVTFSEIKVCKKDPYASVTNDAVRKVYAYDDSATCGTLPTPSPRMGYVFEGWFTAETGGEQVSENSGLMHTNVTLYSRWKGRECEVTLDPQGGSNGTESVTATYGKGMPAIAKPIREHYLFDGYFAHDNEEPYYDANGASIREWNRYDVDQIILYAHWNGAPYPVALDPSPGSGATAVVATYDEYMPDIEEVPTLKGYDFGGYTNTAGTLYYDEKGKGVLRWESDSTNTTLYAKWMPKGYKVIFDGNGADGGTMEPQPFTYDVPAPLSSNQYTRTGYSFSHWQTMTGESYADHANYTLTGTADQTLYAQWLADTYTVTFDANGGEGGTSGKQDYGSTITAPTVTRTGYTFTGWSPEVAATVPANDVTYTAQWGVKQYTVTFDANGGDGGTSGKQDYGSTITAPTVTRTGYTFTGWSPSVAPTVPTSDVTYTAQWSINQYTVTFNANGGEGGTSGRQDYGSTITAPTVTRTGYTFTGWSPEVAATVPANNVTYTAQWDVKQYTVTFDANGGDGGTSGKQDYGSAITAPTVTRTGYTFTRWLPSVAAMVPANDVTYTAQWTANNYTVTLERHGAENSPTYVVATYGEAMPSATKPVRTGYTFGGYWTEENGAGMQYYAGDGSSARTWDIALETTLHAQWTPRVDISIEFKKNSEDAEGNMPSMDNCTFGTQTTLKTCEFTRKGYTFDGWKELTGSEKYEDGANYTVTTIYPTLYAQWKPNTYEVVFNANGGDGDAYSMSCTYGVTTNLTPCAFTRTGHDFAGWATNVEEGVVFTNCAEVLNVATGGVVNLYAKWSTNQYTVTFDANGGEGGTSGKLDYGSAITAPTVTREGHTFTGWSPSVPATVPVGGGTYTAQWSINQYTVTFDANGGEGGTSGKQDYGSAITTPTVTRTGYTFTGWSPSVATTVPADDVTYVAQWSINQYTVTFNANGGDGGTSGKQDYGSAITAPTVTREGHTFTGWSPSVAATVPANDVTYTAQWSVNQYTVTFDANGGNGGTSGKQDYGSAITAPTVTREGYTFMGWSPSVPATVPVGGGTYTAQWSINQYTVTFNANGGDGGTSGKQDYGSAITAPTVTREGHTFTGWSPSVAATVPANDVTYAAQWSVNQYTVTFDANGGDGGTSGKQDYGSAITAPTVTRMGYTFTGWSPSVAASVPASDVTYTAQWSINQYTVTFNANGGDGGTSDKQDFGSAITAPTVMRTGYTFNGWSPDVATTVPANNVTYTAQWTAKTYTVTLNRQGADNGHTSVQTTYGEAMPGATMPVRTGYTFGGYWTLEDGGGTQYYAANGTSAKVWDIDSATTLYAQWTPKTNISIVFDKNSADAEGTMTPMNNCTFGAPTTLKTCEFTRKGYTFDGWKELNGSVKYEDGSAYTVTTLSPTLYAQWKPNTYEVVFNANGGEGDAYSMSCVYDVATNLPPCAFTRTGHDFAGWATNVEEGVVFTNCEEVVNLAEGGVVNLYAQWAGVAYTVTLNQQGGSGGTESVTATYGADMPMAEMPTRSGYDFFGYYEYADGVGEQYYNADGTSSQPWNVTSNTTLHAYWGTGKFSVTFNKQGGAGGASSTQATYGAPMPNIEPPSLTGYTFGGYYTESNGGGTKYYNADGTSAHNWDKTASTTLFAKWTVKSYTVTLEPSPGTGGTPSVTATYGAAMPTAEMPERVGYDFGGYTNSIGTLYYNASGASVRNWDVDGDAQLYAQWTACTYTITFDPQGGTGGTPSVTATYGAAMPMAEMPTRDGYEFCSYTNSTGTTYYDHTGASARNWDLNSDAALYAQWNANTYTVLFKPNGGAGDAYSMPCTYDAVTNLTPCAFTRTGYGFAGWTTNGADGVVFTDEAAISNLTAVAGADVELLACWTANAYTVKFDANNGTGDPLPSIALTYDAVTNLTPCAFTRTGYTFAGWATTAGGDVAYVNGASISNLTVTANGTVTLFACWTPGIYTVTLDRRGANTGDSSVDATYDADMPHIELPQLTGYDFGGYTNSAGIGYYGASGNSLRKWDVADDATLHAMWSPKSYEVTFSGNGADGGSMASQIFEYGVPAPLSSNQYTRTGYTFDHWVSKSDSSTTYADGETYTLPGAAAQTLDAHWKSNAYEVKFNANSADATGTMPSLPCTYDVATNLTPCAFERTGYGFAGWTNGVGVVFEDGAAISNLTAEAGASVELLACWTGIVYTVSFIPNGADGGEAVDPLSCTYDVQTNLTPCAFTRTGYGFAGWTTNGADGVVFENGALVSNLTVNAGEDVALVACWTGTVYTVALDQQGGVNGTESVKATYGAAMPSATMPEREGYTFGGYTNVVGTQYYGANGASARTWNVASDTTLYAQWVAHGGHVVNLDPQGGSNGTANVTATYGAAMPLATMPEREGYTFGGYTNVVGMQYYDASGACVRNWDVDGNATLYAQWTPNAYTVTLDPQPGSGGTPSVTATYGAAMPNAVMPERAGYAFGGYTNATGVLYYNADGTSARNWDFASDAALYAQWMPNTYEVVFNANAADATGTMPSLPCTYDVATNLTPCAFTRTGYGFAGWTTNGADGVVFANEATISNLTAEAGANVELLACWTANAYTLTFNTDGGTAVDPITQDYGTAITPPADPTKDGYKFAGWNPALPLTMPAQNKTVTAQWTVNQYTISFAANAADATGTMTPMTCTYDVATNLAQCAFDRTGYGFAGWTNSNNEVFADGALVVNLTATDGADVELFACWTGAVYTVTLDPQDGSGGTASTTATFDAAMPTITPPNRDGYTFGGYTNDVGTLYYNADGSSANSWNIASDAILYAKWSANAAPVSLAEAVDAPALEFNTFGRVQMNMFGDPSTDEQTNTLWFAQTSEKDYGTHAAQSGALPKNTDDFNVYVSYMTTTVTGQGELSFMWKLSAKNLEEGLYGDSLRFGTYSDTGFNELTVSPLTGNAGWVKVTYTKTTDDPETFAWAFMYMDGGYNNGGGTGYVDRVTWTPSE